MKKPKGWTLKEDIANPWTSSSTPSTTIHELLIKLLFPLNGEMAAIRRLFILSKSILAYIWLRDKTQALCPIRRF